MQKRKIRPDPIIPDHEVLRKIGGGAYGEVWLARGVTGALRAVKIVYREDFSDERTFEREFEGILKFEPISRDHPGLVHILHVGRSTGEGELPFYYYVMELGDDAHSPGEINPAEYEPRTVRSDALKTPGIPLDTNLCVETGRRLAEALQHLHECELTHRDVKPSNIIFVEGKAKLADIGLVAALDQRTFVGTEGFVPPEGPGTVGADVYSLGKVLYEMATGMDRLQFPELPVERPDEDDRKKWIKLNRIICDVCEPRVEKRKIKSASSLVEQLTALEEGKKIRRKIPAGVKIMAVIVAFLSFFIFQIWFQASWGTRVIEGRRVPLPPEWTRVTIISQPPAAEVYLDGLLQGPTRFDFPEALVVGSTVNVVLKKEGYRPLEVPIQVESNDQVQVVEVELLVDAPPIENEIWKDALGMVYNPEGRNHVSSQYVGEREWNLYRLENDLAEGDHEPYVISHSAYGEETKIVLVKKSWTDDYADWLESKCREEGYLPRDLDELDEKDREIKVKFYNTGFGKIPDGAPSGWRPFQLEVRPIPYVIFEINTEPAGAEVFIDTRYIGTTPWSGKIQPGIVTYTVALEGYKTVTGHAPLSDLQDPPPKLIKLRPDKSVRFGQGSWKNSLGMEFVPLGEDLMVGVHEVRVKDYRHFLTSQEKEPEILDFSQTEEHPVVNVTRGEAEEFCRWLTNLEKSDRLSRIKERNEYRLPSDSEWSQMVDLAELGETPAQRESENPDVFPWGEGTWPPPVGSGNYGDEMIENYEDEYRHTAPVGRFGKNTLGIADLGGNVFEWVSDNYQEDSFLAVARGGSWESHDEAHLLLSHRDLQRNDTRLVSHGFRVVISRIANKESVELEESEDLFLPEDLDDDFE